MVLCRLPSTGACLTLPAALVTRQTDDWGRPAGGLREVLGTACTGLRQRESRGQELVQAVSPRGPGFQIALDDGGAGNAGLGMLCCVLAEYVELDRGVLAHPLAGSSASGFYPASSPLPKRRTPSSFLRDWRLRPCSMRCTERACRMPPLQLASGAPKAISLLCPASSCRLRPSILHSCSDLIRAGPACGSVNGTRPDVPHN